MDERRTDKLAQSMTQAQRDRINVLGHSCEHNACRKVAG
jgi:hypothetical protein